MVKPAFLHIPSYSPELGGAVITQVAAVITPNA
jgi:hypothetical protein